MSNSIQELPTAVLIETAFAVRKSLEEYDNECKKAREPMANRLSVLEGEILRRFNAEDIKTLKTESGAVTKVVTTQYSIEDPESFYEFVIREGATQLFPKKVLKGEVETYSELNGRLPDGIAPTSALTLRFTKAKGQK